MASETAVRSAPAWQRWIAQRELDVRAFGRWCAAAAARDWRGERVWSAGFVTALLACALVLAFHLNRPNPFMPYHDSYEYVSAADRILAGGWWMDATRMPGYPLLLAGIFLLFGKDNLAAADAIQQALFIVSAVEVYILAYHVWRRARFALVVGALFATNFYFLNYVKPILSDGLALVLTVSIALFTLTFIERPSARRFWVLALCVLALIMTRAEWLLFPLPLFAAALWCARERTRLRRMLPHALAAVVLIYAMVVVCVATNARVNGYAGLTDAQEINLFGKVTQYHMQDLAPPRFGQLTQLTDWYVTDDHVDPWYIYRAQPWLGANHFTLLGAYARAVVLRHPAQFVARSIPMAFRSLYQYWAFEQINPAGRGAGALNALQQFSAVVYPLFMLFPLIAAGWALVLVARRGSAHVPRARAICIVSGIAMYDLIMTTLGSYGEYPRLHLAFDPLMLVVVVGTLMLLAGGHRGAARPEKPPAPAASRVEVLAAPTSTD